MNAPNVKPSSRGYKSASLKLIFEPTGERLTIAAIARRSGLRIDTLRTRWIRAGKPRAVSKDMVRPPVLLLVYGPTGEELSIRQIAGKTGVNVETLRNRWINAGYPHTITAELVRPAAPARPEIRVEYPPYGIVTFREIRDIHKSMKRDSHYFRERWKRKGSPKVISAEMFDHPDMRRIKDRTVPVPTDPKYLDDSLWTPDVPYADLCHLSNTENTGAGKGAIPDEEWARMGSSVRSIMAGLYRRIPAAGTGGD